MYICIYIFARESEIRYNIIIPFRPPTTVDVSYFIVSWCIGTSIKGKVEKETLSTTTYGQSSTSGERKQQIEFYRWVSLIEYIHVPYKQARANKPCWDYKVPRERAQVARLRGNASLSNPPCPLLMAQYLKTAYSWLVLKLIDSCSSTWLKVCPDVIVGGGRIITRTRVARRKKERNTRYRRMKTSSLLRFPTFLISCNNKIRSYQSALLFFDLSQIVWTHWPLRGL